MKNLIKKINSESKKELLEFKKELNSLDSIKDTLSGWRYQNLLTLTTKKKDWESLKELKDYLLKRFINRTEKSLSDKLNRIDYINKATDFKKITISIEWKKSRMWGSNPTAKAGVIDNAGYHHFYSGSIGGCGFDKQSTAIANVLNQCNGVLKKLYNLKNKNINKDNRKLFGYGSGYGLLPYIEGGVGVSCYPEIFDKIGYKFENIVSGKTFDVFEITKKRK